MVYCCPNLGSAPLLLGVDLPFDLDKFLAFASGSGFGCFVAAWFMIRSDRVISDHTKALNELTNTLAVLLRRDGVTLRVGMGGSEAQRDK